MTIKFSKLALAAAFCAVSATAAQASPKQLIQCTDSQNAGALRSQVTISSELDGATSNVKFRRDVKISQSKRPFEDFVADELQAKELSVQYLERDAQTQLAVKSAKVNAKAVKSIVVFSRDSAPGMASDGSPFALTAFYDAKGKLLGAASTWGEASDKVTLQCVLKGPQQPKPAIKTQVTQSNKVEADSKDAKGVAPEQKSQSEHEKQHQDALKHEAE